MNSIITGTDSYKVSHWKQYPPGTTRVFSYIEARGGGSEWPDVTFFGLQYILKEHLVGRRVYIEDIEEAKTFFAAHFGRADLFNEDGWNRIIDTHHGRLPLLIKAVREGTTVSIGNVLVTVENTDPELPWLTNYVETLLCQVWYPCTVATQSRGIRQIVGRYLDETGDPALLPFKVHDFGYRGSTSVESAGLGAAAHLLSFQGTDTLAGIEVARYIYDHPMAGFSIPAAEHSTITAWGRDGEVAAYSNMLDQFPGLIAVVSDSYDVFNACESIWGETLHDRVMERDGCLVIRPDSGDPVDTVIKVLHILGTKFPISINTKGFKVLDPHIRIIQGDGIDPHMILRILSHMKDAGWSADNIAFGSGGGLLQKVNRDTLGFAFKTSAIEINGEWRDVYKDPVTDTGKRSKRGRLDLYNFQAGPGWETRREGQYQGAGLLVPVFENGELLVNESFDEIRVRAQR